MRKAMRRISAGFLGAGMIVALTAGVTAGAADAATTFPAAQSPQTAAVTWPIVSRGDAVRALQHQLRYAYGHRSVVVNGYFGQKTLAAVKIFQRNHKLTADGIVGNATWKALVRGSR